MIYLKFNLKLISNLGIMNKRQHFLIVLVLIIGLFSCENYSDTSSKIKIGFSQSISEDDVWRKSMDNSMKVEASLHPEIDLSIYNANSNSKKQISDVENMIDNHMDVIIIAPLGNDSIIPAIDKAYDKGIPIIILDRKVNTSNYTTFIGSDNVEVGKIAGKYIASRSKNNAKVLEIRATTNISPGVERSLGFKNVLSQFKSINRLSITAGDLNSLNKSFSNVLDSIDDLNYVFAFTDAIALQVWDVANKKNKLGNIKFIGVDGLNGPNGGIQAVKDGRLNATVLYPTGGSEAIKTAIKILNKEIVPKNIKLATTLIDSLNADIMSNQFDKVSQQMLNIEQQQNVIKEQEKEYITLFNLIKLLTFFIIVIIFLVLFSVYNMISIRNKNRMLQINNDKISLQKNEIQKYAKKLKTSNEAKINFFTGISHEFKTPLTLILSAVESLNDEFSNKNQHLKKELMLMHNNSMRLLRLINQLLDFRKIENKDFSIRPSKINLYHFSVNIFDEFRREAIKKKIDYNISSNCEELEVYIDQNLMDKVYYNLLSNAFKFTPENGKIQIQIQKNQSSNTVSIIFKDNGIGIPSEEKNQIFEIYYQGSNSTKKGSGIGLNLSKKFVELHQGTIEVFSDNGTEFNVTIPIENQFSDDVLITPETSSSINKLEYEYFDTDSSSPIADLNSDEKQSILIIEDNPELLNFLISKLQTDYFVYSSNGYNAIEKVFETIPDIVLCDLNLPEKNGFEICTAIKSTELTSHIPTIILTAMDGHENYIKSLESGADLFLNKPFNYKVLQQSIKNLLFNRERLRSFYSKNNTIISDIIGIGKNEKDFLNKIDDILNANMDNSNFSVEELASCLHISRVQLYRKVKAILNIGIGDYIINFRLDKAVQLLKESDLNISEIAYSCGFASPNYFSTAFKNKYLMSPKEYRNSL